MSNISLLDIKENIFSIIAKARNNHSIKRIGVFGSMARGDYDESSDIDIAVDYQLSNCNLDDVVAFCELKNEIYDKLSVIFKRDVDVLDYNALLDGEGLFNMTSTKIFKNEIDEEMIWIYGEEY